MKKFFTVIQWMVLFLLVAFGLYFGFRPRPWPHRTQENWSSWNGFVALSYPGVNRGLDAPYFSSDQLRAQLEALQKAGYETITPADALAFLEGRSPLPKKALLLLFEGGRKDSLLYSTPILYDTGFMATMLIPTSLTKEWGNFYIKQNEIGKIQRKPHWNIGSMGDKAHTLITTGPNGEQGHYLTALRWENGVLESPVEYRARVAGDFGTSAKLLQKLSGEDVPLYLVPFADVGSAPDAYELALPVITKALRQYYKLAFLGGWDPYNGYGSNPYDLTRLRTTSEWSPDELITYIERSRPRTEAVSGVGVESDWSLSGRAALQDDKLIIGDGTTAWLRGTTLWRDVDLQATVRHLKDAQTAVYVRYNGATSYVRLLISDEVIRVQERIGSRMQTLAVADGVASTRTLSVQVRCRGNRAWIRVDDKPVGGYLPLTPGTTQGRIGFEALNGQIELLALEARPLPDSLLLLGEGDRPEPELVDAYSSIVEPWRAPQTGQPLASEFLDGVLLRSARGIQTIPWILEARGQDEDAQQRCAERVMASLKQPPLKALIDTVAVPASATKLIQLLEAAEVNVMVVVPLEEAAKLSGRGLGPLHDALILTAPSESLPYLTPLLKVRPAQSLIIEEAQDKDTNWPFGIRIAHAFSDRSKRE